MPLCALIEQLIGTNCAFSLYRLPQQEEVTLIVDLVGGETLSDLSHLDGREGFLISPFDLKEETPIVLIKPDLMASGRSAISSLLETIKSPKRPKRNADFVECDNDRARYAETFSDFMSFFAYRNARKIVLSRYECLPHVSATKFVNAFDRALDRYPQAMVALFYSPVTDAWLTCTPEVMIQGGRNSWKTVALAGTMWADKKNNVPRWSNKNITEQELVADFISRQLQSLNIQYQMEQRETIKAGDLWHLQSRFSFQTDSVWEVLSSLYPTPAICGSPREDAYHFIINREGYRRGYYSGIIGPISKDQSSLFINLRCARYCDNQLFLYAGGGLLSDSVMETEYMETIKKMETIRTLL